MAKFLADIPKAIEKLEKIKKLQKLYGSKLGITLDGEYVESTILNEDTVAQIDAIIRKALSYEISILASQMGNEAHISVNASASIPHPKRAL